MLLFGFSINTLTLFGLVLAIGIVVDDAIVVVENVERNIERGFDSKDATYRAMHEVSGPIIAIALVLCAVFVPIAFVSGLTGQFYRQFALTIAISTVISAFNSLTLSPALAALLLAPHDAPKDWLTRCDGPGVRLVLPLVQPARSTARRTKYESAVARVLNRKALAFVVYLVLLGVTWFGFQKPCRTGSFPSQDKQYLVGFAQLPDGASLDRTEEVIRRMSDIAMKTPGREGRGRLPRPVDRRLHQRAQRRASCSSAWTRSRTGKLAAALGRRDRRGDQPAARRDPGRVHRRVPAAAGQRSRHHRRLQAAGRGSRGAGRPGALRRDEGDADEARGRRRSSRGVFSSFQINVPQLFADVDRAKAKRMGVALTDVFDTMQINLGSLYVNDFNRFGRTYQVVVQADAPYRSRAEDIAHAQDAQQRRASWCRSARCCGSTQSFGPDRVIRYNAFPVGGPERRRRRRASARARRRPRSSASRRRPCRAASRSSGPTSPTRRSWPATPRCSSSRCACCSCSWCWPRSTRASSCRSRSS